jgi:coatomer subunit beta'
VYKNFKERTGSPMKAAGSWAIDGLHGGTLLGARGSGFVVFWDWESGEIVRRIDVDAKNVCILADLYLEQISDTSS